MRYIFLLLFCCGLGHCAPELGVDNEAEAAKEWVTCHNPSLTDNEEFHSMSAPVSFREETNMTDEEKVEDILRLLELGEREIELSEREIVLLIGMTGSGKSTITKFVAGLDEQLESVWTDLGFVINDRFGDSVGNQSSISKTLLPELTVDRTGLGFYDCPGYADTRNVSVEIANGFFIKKVVDFAHSVKVVVVVQHGALLENREYMHNLLKQLVVFIRNVEKFQSSISLMVNFVSRDNGDLIDLLIIRNKLIALRGELGSTGFPSQHLHAAQRILDSMAAVDGNNQSTRLGIMRRTNSAGILDRMPLYQCTKPNMRDVIWENIDFAEKVEEDFGFGLSDTAILLIDKLVRSIDARISTYMITAGFELSANFTEMLDAFLLQQEPNDGKLEELLVNLTQAEYPLSEGSSNLPPADYVEEIRTNWLAFAEENEFLDDIQRNADYLQFFQNASEHPIQINPAGWVAPLKQTKVDVLAHIGSFASSLNSDIAHTLGLFAENATNYYLSELDKLGSDDRVDVEALRSSLSALYDATYPISDNVENAVIGVYLAEIISVIRGFGVPGTEQTVAYLLHRGSQLEFFARIRDISVTPKTWVPSLHNLKYAIVNHVPSVVTQLSSRVQNFTNSVEDELLAAFRLRLDELTADEPIDLPRLGADLQALYDSSYPLCQSSTNSTCMEYIGEIISALANFSNLNTLTLTELATRLDLLEMIFPGVSVTPSLWVRPLLNLRNLIVGQIPSVVDQLNRKVFESMMTLFGREEKILVLHLSSIGAIAERKSTILQLQADLGRAQAALESALLTPGLSLPQFVWKVLNETLKFNPDSDTVIVSNLMPPIELIEWMLEENDWTQIPDWLVPFKKLPAKLEAERKWLENLIELLFEELSGSSYHVEDVNGLGTWWTVNGPLTTLKLRSFWNKFGVTITIRNMPYEEANAFISEDEAKLVQLNTLLNSVYESGSRACDNDGDMVTVKGNFLSTKDLKDCLWNKTAIHVLAYHTFFMDDPITAQNIGGTNILIVAPNIVVRNGQQPLNLNGMKGASQPAQSGGPGNPGDPGKPGYNSGNAVVIVKNYAGEIRPSLVGGEGGDGQAGAAGSTGSNGKEFVFDKQSGEPTLIVKSQCDAFSGGEIEVYVRPHWCSPSQEGNSNRCHADNNGAEYRMPGSDGGNGGRGGDGGAPGKGGSRGTMMLFEVDRSPTTKHGQIGEPGSPGAGGSGGSGGRKGPTSWLRIDDRTAGNKECKIVSGPTSEPVNDYADNGTKGTEGRNSQGIQDPAPNDFTIEFFAWELRNYVKGAEELYGNDFLGELLKVFVQKMEEQLIPTFAT